MHFILLETFERDQLISRNWTLLLKKRDVTILLNASENLKLFLRINIFSFRVTVVDGAIFIRKIIRERLLLTIEDLFY